ncbi:MAG: TetR/AcrR family transcriptional regulator [Candidatus Thorarchaeota archaeon]
MPKVVPEYKEQARQKIIEAGTKVFIQRGYYKTKMDDIAEAMGVSKGAIYQYFKSKEQLFSDVIEFMMTFRKDEIMSIILSDNPMRIASAEFFSTKIERALETRSIGLDLFLEAGRNETLRVKMAEMYEKSYQEFVGHIEDLKNQGIVKRDADVSIVWRGMVALRDGLISSVLSGADVSMATKTWEKVTTILLREVLAEK